MAVKEEEVLSVGVVEELEVDQYWCELGSYYFVYVCYKFQAGLVMFCLGVLNIK